MLKILISSLVLYAIIISASAQNFKGGLVGGVLGSQIDGDFLGGYNKLGLTVGAWVSHPVSDNLLIHGQLKYIQKGKTKPANVDAGTSSETTRLHYLQLPITVQYVLSTDWFIEGGLGLGYLYDYSFYEGGTRLNEDDYPIREDQLYRGEFFFIIGAGYNINDSWSVNLRFTNDILPVGDLTDAVGTNPWIDLGNLYNKTMELTLIYSFNR